MTKNQYRPIQSPVIVLLIYKHSTQSNAGCNSRKNHSPENHFSIIDEALTTFPRLCHWTIEIFYRHPDYQISGNSSSSSGKLIKFFLLRIRVNESLYPKWFQIWKSHIRSITPSTSNFKKCTDASAIQIVLATSFNLPLVYFVIWSNGIIWMISIPWS